MSRSNKDGPHGGGHKKKVREWNEFGKNAGRMFGGGIGFEKDHAHSKLRIETKKIEREALEEIDDD